MIKLKTGMALIRSVINATFIWCQKITTCFTKILKDKVYKVQNITAVENYTIYNGRPEQWVQSYFVVGPCRSLEESCSLAPMTGSWRSGTPQESRTTLRLERKRRKRTRRIRTTNSRKWTAIKTASTTRSW